MAWEMEGPAIKVAVRLSSEAQTVPNEVMKLDDQTAAIVVDIDGTDYILTMARVPVQRPRRVEH